MLPDELPGRCELKGIQFFANHDSFHNGVFDEIQFFAAHSYQDRLGTAFTSNYVYGLPSQVYYRESEDIKFTVGEWNEFVFDTPFIYNGEESLLLEFRYDGCSSHSIYNLGWLNTDSVRVIDGYLGQETGFPRQMMISFRLVFTPLTTVSAHLTCSPFTGTLPFTTTLGVGLVNNVDDQQRTAAGHIDLLLGNGVVYENWRSGWADLPPAGWSRRAWNQVLPAHPAFLGNSEFRLIVEDVTPAPFNQPPYLASGDVDSRVCTLVGAAE